MAGQKWLNRTTKSLGQAASIAAGSDGTVIVLKNGRPFRWNAENESFEPFPGEFVQVVVGGSRQIWAVDTAGRVVKWDGESWKPLPDMRKFTFVSASEDGTLWTVDGVGNIYRLDSTLLPTPV